MLGKGAVRVAEWLGVRVMGWMIFGSWVLGFPYSELCILNSELQKVREL